MAVAQMTHWGAGVSRAHSERPGMGTGPSFSTDASIPSEVCSKNIKSNESIIF